MHKEPTQTLSLSYCMPTSSSINILSLLALTPGLRAYARTKAYPVRTVALHTDAAAHSLSYIYINKSNASPKSVVGIQLAFSLLCLEWKFFDPARAQLYHIYNIYTLRTTTTWWRWFTRARDQRTAPAAVARAAADSAPGAESRIAEMAALIWHKSLLLLLLLCSCSFRCFFYCKKLLWSYTCT